VTTPTASWRHPPISGGESPFGRVEVRRSGHARASLPQHRRRGYHGQCQVIHNSFKTKPSVSQRLASREQ
jgi:hypothetical protein